MKDVVLVTCYGRTEKMGRKEAMEKFYEGMLSCDPNSSEAQRYTSIYVQLARGAKEATDTL